MSYHRKLALSPSRLATIQLLGAIHLKQRRRPILSSLSLLEMLNINMIEPFIQSCRSMTPQRDPTITEPTPKARLASQIKSIICHRSDNLIFLHPMLSQVLGIYFRSVKESLTVCTFARVMDSAEPAWDGEMLGALVAFPVGFATERLCTVGKCTAVRTFVALLMFSVVC
jgi:hypothetical protein